MSDAVKSPPLPHEQALVMLQYLAGMPWQTWQVRTPNGKGSVCIGDMPREHINQQIATVLQYTKLMVCVAIPPHAVATAVPNMIALLRQVEEQSLKRKDPFVREAISWLEDNYPQ